MTSQSRKIVINSQDFVYFLEQNDIMFCQSDDCYTIIILNENVKITIPKSLTKFSKELSPNCFIRISQSNLINKNYIRTINKKKKQIILTNLTMIPFTLPIKELISKLNLPEQAH